MPRSLRLEYRGSVYHVINRGNYRQDLFVDEKTCLSFECCLFACLEKCDWDLLGYCLMSNHYHLIIRTNKGNLSYGMRWLQSTWATRFNKYRKESGRLFQGRFKSLIVDDVNYLGGLVDYVHLNPLRAGICTMEQLRDYRWSSYWYLRNKGKRPERMLLDEALYSSGEFTDNKKGYRLYDDYLKWLMLDEKAQKDLLFDKLCHGWAIGDKAFKKGLLAKAGLEKAAQEKGKVPYYEGKDMKDLNAGIWERSLQKCLKYLRKGKKEISNDLKSAKWKIMIASVLKLKTSASNVWITERLNMGIPQAVSRYVSEFEGNPKEMKNKDYKQLIKKITE